MYYPIVAKNSPNFVMAHCSTAESAKRYLKVTLPEYVSRGYLMDKTLKADAFIVGQPR